MHKSPGHSSTAQKVIFLEGRKKERQSTGQTFHVQDQIRSENVSFCLRVIGENQTVFIYCFLILILDFDSPPIYLQLIFFFSASVVLTHALCQSMLVQLNRHFLANSSNNTLIKQWKSLQHISTNAEINCLQLLKVQLNIHQTEL